MTTTFRRRQATFVCACLSAAAAVIGCDGSALLDGGARDGGPGVDADVDAGTTSCTAFEPPVEAGRIDDPALDELSGLAASRRHPGYFYAHNDSGDEARVFVLDAQARVVGTLRLEGATHVDYEDIAVGPGPDGEPWVWVGDVGDNAARDGRGTARTEVAVHRFVEPDALPSGATDVTVETITLTYPAAPHDCEALFVDPNGDLLLLTKEDVGPSTLYRAAAPQPSTVELEAVASLELGGAHVPGSRNATAADLSPAGGGLLVRSYNRIHLFVRGPSEAWSEVLSRPALGVPARAEPQGEAVAWLADGRGYVTASEGAHPPLLRFETSNPDCDPL